MPLQDLMYVQVAELAKFFEPSPVKIWHWRFPLDLKHVVVKILAGLQDDEDNNNVFMYMDVPAQPSEGYFSLVREELEKELADYADEFQQVGVKIPERKAEKGSFAEKLARRCDAVAKAFPSGSGSLVLIFDAGEIANPAEFATGFETLVHHAKDPKTKFLLLDEGKSEELNRLRTAGDALTGQDFQLNPVAIEQQVKMDLEAGGLNDAELRQYTAMAGSFAYANGKLDEALGYQTKAADLAVKNGEPADAATALYNLGNTHLKAKRLPEAESCFDKAAELALEAENNGLLAMALVNLGVTYSRQGRIDDAVQTLDIGRQAFGNVGQVAGEVHALDTKAAALFEAKRNPNAEQTWREALRLVSEIQNPDFEELRKSCRSDLYDKLERFYDATGQGDKKKALAAERNA